jgi:hypothetical protein
MVKEHLSAAKEQYLLEGQKAYIAINGAGAAALLAFLQAIWAVDSAKSIRVWVLLGIIAFAFGSAAGALSYPVRHRAFVTNASNDAFFLYRIAYWYIPGVAILSFILGLLFPVIGAFLSL